MRLPSLIQYPDGMLQSWKHDLRIKNKSEVDAGYWEVTRQVSGLKTYTGIDMAKDKFDYCALDSDLNVLCRGKDRANSRSEFEDFVTILKEIKKAGSMTIGMESTEYTTYHYTTT